jgi:hypothetical protein
VGSSNGRENLNRFGGEPASIQHFEYEPCPDCGRSMTFIGQLDRASLLGDEGGTYILWCDPCTISAITYQVVRPSEVE